MRIAVTGASGLLGRELLPLLISGGHEVYVAVHTRPLDGVPGNHQVPFDLNDDATIERFVDICRADVVIHAAASTDVDGCERDPASALRWHGGATDVLATAARAAGSRVVYISTDYVFDGLDGPYDETAQPNPINQYGRTKLIGEKPVLQVRDDNLVIRAGSFLGVGPPGETTFAQRMVDVMLNRPPVLAPDDQRSNITPVEFLAAGIVELTTNGASGVRHIAPPFVLSRYEFALKLADAFGLGHENVKRIEFASLRRDAARPLNGGLTTRYPLVTPAPDLESVIASFKSQYQSADSD